MLLLYKNLGIEQTATTEEVEKSYKLLAFTYLNTKNKEKLLEANTSYNILKDSYNRALYDKFGDRILPNLLNPSESYFISRFFVKENILFLTFFMCFNIINYFFLGAFFYIPIIPLRFILFLISPLFLIFTLINSWKHFGSENPYFYIFIRATILILFISNSLLVISFKFHILFLIFNEILLGLYILIDKNLSFKILAFLILKSFSLMTYYTEWENIKFFIPTFILSFLSIFDYKIGISLAIACFPMCLSIYLANIKQFYTIFIGIHILHSFLGLFLINLVTRNLLKLLLNKKTRILKSLPASKCDI